MKIVNGLLCAVFVLSAILQYNDPDPYIWVPIYLFPAILCLLAIRDKYYPKAYLFGIAFCTMYALWLFFDQNGVLNWARMHDAENIMQSMKATKPWIEETREFFGLLIIIVALMLNLIQYRKRRAY